MPSDKEKPALAVLIASKAKKPKDAEGGDPDKAAEEMAGEIMSAFKDGDSKAAGKAMMNFFKFMNHTCMEDSGE